MTKKLFITGTGTDIGKTYVTALLVKKLQEHGLKAAYYKAAMSGNVRRTNGSLIPGDAAYVKEISGISQPLESMCPYIYENAVSPHLASRIEGNPVALATVKTGFETVCEEYEYVTMEGSGGIICPICFDEARIQLEDVIKALDLSCLIVADAGLGTINNVVLTVEYMSARNIPIKGILMNHYHPGNIMEEDNVKMCEILTGIKVLACLEYNCTDLPMGIDDLTALYA